MEKGPRLYERAKAGRVAAPSIRQSSVDTSTDSVSTAVSEVDVDQQHHTIVNAVIAKKNLSTDCTPQSMTSLSMPYADLQVSLQEIVERPNASISHNTATFPMIHNDDPEGFVSSAEYAPHIIRTASPSDLRLSLQKTKNFVPLALLSDVEWLSAPLCLVRAQMEVVAFTKESIDALDKPSFGRGGRLDRILSQNDHIVGVRCGWCAHLPYCDRARGAVSFPEATSVMHQTVRNFKRYHFRDCKLMPKAVLEQMQKYDKRPKYWQSKKGSDAYWGESCKALGLVDLGGSDKGICFKKLPKQGNDDDSEVSSSPVKAAVSRPETNTSSDEGGPTRSSSNEAEGCCPGHINSPSTTATPPNGSSLLGILASAAHDAKPFDADAPSLPPRKRKLLSDEYQRNQKFAKQA